MLINGKQGAADRGAGRWKGKEGEAVIDCTACVLVARKMMTGGGDV